MGESADQTRDEIVRLRQDMSQKVAALKKATDRPIRIAKMAAIGTVAVVVIGGAALVVMRARRRAEARTLKGRAKSVARAVGDPAGTARQTGKEAQKAAAQAREKLRDELKKQVQEQVKDVRPLHEKILTGAVQSAASAAIPIIMHKLQERVDPTPVASRK
jgi:hypothetical protein